MEGMSNLSESFLYRVCGLSLRDERMTDKAIQHLVLREGCKPVGLSAFRVKDAMQQPNAKQAVFCVVEKALYSPKSGISSKSSYLITDVRATRARLSASTEVPFSRMVRNVSSNNCVQLFP